MDCCELALFNAKLALYIALGAFGTIVFLLTMFFGYNLKLDKKGAKLEKTDQDHEHKIKKLEQKNGHEQHQIEELKQEIAELKKTKS